MTYLHLFTVNRLEAASLYPIKKRILGLFLDGANALVLQEVAERTEKNWPRIDTDETRIGRWRVLLLFDPGSPLMGLGD
jgi:hypothetical protein